MANPKLDNVYAKEKHRDCSNYPYGKAYDFRDFKPLECERQKKKGNANGGKKGACNGREKFLFAALKTCKELENISDA